MKGVEKKEQEIEICSIHGNCWSNRIKDNFDIEEFERAFKNITQHFQKDKTK